jgi:DNA-binding HxlR family transcriptional regulator
MNPVLPAIHAEVYLFLLSNDMNNEHFLAGTCPLVRAMGRLDSKWKPIIIYNLAQDTLRFGKLSERLPLITRKVLSDQLKELEQGGIVQRKAYRELPPRVEYALTKNGLDLLPALQSVAEWNMALEKTLNAGAASTAQGKH